MQIFKEIMARRFRGRRHFVRLCLQVDVRGLLYKRTARSSRDTYSLATYFDRLENEFTF